MRKQIRAAGRAPRVPANVRALVAALLLFAGVITLINSCGGDDLVFPGNVPPTEPQPTNQNTATEVP
jgi:hypothetical protein